MFVPDNRLTAVADVTYVLNQSPGKLRIKDVKVGGEAWKGCKAMCASCCFLLGVGTPQEHRATCATKVDGGKKKV